VQPGEELRFQLGLNGVNAAELQIGLQEATENGQRLLAVTYDFHTIPAIDRIWSYHLSGRTLMDPHTLLPVQSERTVTKNDREKHYATRFDRASGMAAVRTWRSDKPEHKVKEIACGGAVDAASAFLLLRTVPFQPGQRFRLVVLDGDDLGEILIAPREPTSADPDVVEIALTVRAIEAAETDEDKAPRHFRVWMDRRSRVPLRIESDMFLGSIYGELVETPLQTGNPA